MTNWLKKHWIGPLLIILVLGLLVFQRWYIPYKQKKDGYILVHSFNCPSDHPIKAHLGSMIYHVTNDTYYSRTDAKNGYCFDNVEHAEKQGFRAPYN